MQALEDLKKLKVAKYKCKKDFLFSTRYLYKRITNRKYTVRHHHQLMANALERVFRGEITRLIITIPPRYGKTELGVKNFIAAGLAVNPASKFLHLSASKQLALENSEGARDIVRHEAYQELFPEVQVKGDTDSKAKWYTTAGGGVYATGAAGQVTGFGAGQTETEDPEDDKEVDTFMSEIEKKEGFAGAIIIDDPVKPDDADSDIKRVRVNNRYFSTIKNRLNSKKTPIIIIMQRLHELDLVGYVLDTEGNAEQGGDWTVLNIPALYTDDNGQYQCLDPTKHTVEDLLKMENHPDVEVRIFFQRQMQQNPQSREGLMFPLQDLRKYDPAAINLKENKEFVFNYTDPANKGGDDLCSIFAYLVGRDIYIDEVIYNTDGTDKNGPRIVDRIVHHECNRGAMEANFKFFTAFGNGVRDVLKTRMPNCLYLLVNNTVNKHTRILAQSPFIRANFVFRQDWQHCSPEYRKFMINLTSYRMVQEGEGKADHDDAPDGCSGVSAFYSAVFKHLWPIDGTKPNM